MWIESQDKRARWGPPTSDWIEVELISGTFPPGTQTVVFEATGPGVLIDSVRLKELPGPRPAADKARQDRIRGLLESYEILGARTGSNVTTGGLNNTGTGAVYLADSGNYGPVSIADALVAAIDNPSAAEQISLDLLRGPLPNNDETEIIALRCADRIGIFSKTVGGLAPNADDSRWWVANDCPAWPYGTAATYFVITDPAGGPDAIRFATARVLIEGFQRLHDETGTVVVDGGFEGRGAGAVFTTNSGDVGSSICVDSNGVAYMGIFTFSDGIEPTAEHEAFWADNNCSRYNIDVDRRPYYVVTES